MTHKKSVRPQ